MAESSKRMIPRMLDGHFRFLALFVVWLFRLFLSHNFFSRTHTRTVYAVFCRAAQRAARRSSSRIHTRTPLLPTAPSAKLSSSLFHFL
ncbi:hypothetical protein DFH11DRAFT_281803 [Phellopilus nigrolimitatus]|nr:hypothetical protein DFH11DRAFT_281803 [Phellopilus nigrolimitatus]